MKPCRELDKIIAEKVMGLSPFMPQMNSFEQQSLSQIPNYSTDITAAHLVLGKVLEQGIWILYRPSHASGFQAFPDVAGEPDWHVIGETIPHAICLAALRAIRK